MQDFTVSLLDAGGRIARCAIAVAVASCLLLGDAQAQTRPAARPDLVTEFLGQGEAAFRRGDFSAATLAWREAARICRTEGRLHLASESLARSAEANLALGFVNVAVAELEQARQTAETVGDNRLTAAVTGALGNAQLIARRYEPAQAMIERSVELARGAGDRHVAAASLNNLGNLLASTDRPSDAILAYGESAELAESVDNYLQVVALRNAGRVHLRRGDADEASNALSHAATAARRMAPSHSKVLAFVSLASLLTGDKTGRFASLAYALLKEAVATAEATRDLRGQSMAFGYLGTLYETNGRPGEAKLLTEQALDLAQREAIPELTYRWDWQLARLLKATGDENGALDAYLRAVRELQEIRRDIPIDYEEGRSSFRETIGPLFLQLADLLLRKAAKAKDAAEIRRYLGQARDTVERIKAYELQDYFKDRCVDSVRRTVNVETVSPQTAVIYPIILPDRMELLVSLADGDSFATVPVKESELIELAGKLRFALEDPESPIAEVLASGGRLYDLVIKPIAGILAAKNIRTLVLVPDGPIRSIPLSALHDGKKFLVESYAIATAPGLTLVDPEPLPKLGMLALVAGISEAVQGFPAIPAAAAEVDLVSKQLGGTRLFDKSFTLSSLEQLLLTQPFRIVHIASHGVFGGTSQDSFVLAYDQKITMDKLEELVKFNRGDAQAVELLTLSACSTAAGDDRAPLGLAGVALKSGARSSIATLWPVSDEAAAELTAHVYGNIAKGELTKAQALQQSQVALIRSAKFSHPAYWAPFLLIGNWL